MKKHKRLCEYDGCRRPATRVLRLKDGTVIARYCKKHYKVVINAFKNSNRW